ncbi:MAG: Ni/Fe hydrogenase subunit alpha [Armatimonadetes bacterium CG2_30_59_28]|nr:Ni/Fe hydrogenase subunit alpha [Armatimonadota bacterium]OIO89888.1 MAG: Ni/Fe hydrogenase subunit alpha [Armatimonadetes bacterium CG2_30_59_28]PIU65661.1 MAG: Ni/Fe hydrogenase subunit alpha [Armatimonadetes bacterium CG07_land_8_20_14_0_80_59_28]PIX39061.1 MAG: Ni/Fe hydrogenase subunit alpha [Armatimonadetes bacterium CG_4_8_14_3_um_filter_58_9]PIY40532.1 MAG: Ni/Fe hydrogenase subunit alpha [Armatimonadetes bacterium CG_4_10_14_3_um_filter_59_10]PJB63911.1 MAG: Ni/Fe hydrogenase subun
MPQDVNIQSNYVTRVEGHGNIILNTKNGEIEELRFDIVEAPRFFEAMLRGRKWYEAADITCRICGICSWGHTTASLNAMENCFGITPSEQTLKLRQLGFNGEQLQSHYLHVLYLVAPDLLGVGSVIPLATTHPDIVQLALRVKRMANDIMCVIGGRHIHPVACKVNGFSHVPRARELQDLKERLVASRADLRTIVDVLKTLSLPDFSRETEYISLADHGHEYAYIRGEVKSSDGWQRPIPEYREWMHEWVEDHSTGKHTKASRNAYMVGALARFNNNYGALCPEAKAVAEELGLQPTNCNPFMNNIAQVVECVHCTEHSVQLIDELLDMGVKQEEGHRNVTVKAGTGVGAADVPRGILFHEYAVDEDGTITGSNLVIPTGQNYANIEADMRAFVPQILDRPQNEIQLFLEMLVRAYDPCISCSVHLLDVKFV